MDPGIVDQTGYAAETAVGSLEQADDIGLFCRIGLNCDGVAALALDISGDLLGQGGFRPKGDANRMTVFAASRAVAAPIPRLPPVTIVMGCMTGFSLS